MSATQPNNAQQSLTCAVLDGGEFAVVRVVGKGTFQVSMAMKQFATLAQRRGKDLKFIIDMASCESMDSTFMGVIAGLAVNHQREGLPKVILANPNEQCRRLLKNLGILGMLMVKAGTSAEVERAESHLSAPDEGAHVDRVAQICMTLDAHKQLVEIDPANEIKFQAVIEYLEKSLIEEKENPPTSSSHPSS